MLSPSAHDQAFRARSEFCCFQFLRGVLREVALVHQAARREAAGFRCLISQFADRRHSGDAVLLALLRAKRPVRRRVDGVEADGHAIEQTAASTS